MQPTRPATATIATALVILLLANLAVDALYRRSPNSFLDWGTNGTTVKVLQLMELRGALDVAILGDSTVETGLVPKALESGSGGCVRSAYNAALAGTNADTWRAWFAEHVAPAGSSTVVIGVGKQDFRGAFGSGALTRYLRSRSRLETFGDQARGLPLVGGLPLVWFREQLSNPTALSNAVRGCGLCEVGSDWDTDGWRRNIALRDFWVPPPGWTQQWERDQALNPSYLLELQMLIAKIRASGPVPVLLRMPDLELIHPLTAQPQVDDGAFTDLLGALAEDEHVLMLDASALRWTEADFVDPHHLNGSGARRLSLWVGKQLASLGNGCER